MPYQDENWLAAELKVHVKTTRNWRRLNIGPPFVRLSNRKGVRYDPAMVQKWIESRKKGGEWPIRRGRRPKR